jgi:hypothetical protein
VAARLSIGRFVATAPPDGKARVARLAESVVQHDLARALAVADVPAGIWCVRRLDLRVSLDLADGDAVLGQAWARALMSRLLEALAGADPDVVHYPGPVHAVADLVASVSLGRTGRAWAWTRAGARERADPDPAVSPGEAIIVSLRRLHGQSPGAGLAALAQAVRHAGLPALHRVLGGPGPRARGGGWPAVAGLLAPGPAGLRPALPAVPDVGAPGDSRGPGPPHGGEPALAGPVPVGPVPAGPVPADGPSGRPARLRLLADELRGRSALARAMASSGLRPDEADAVAWAALVLAETDPSALGLPSASELLREVAAPWAGPAPAATRVRPARGDRADRAGPAVPRPGPESGRTATAAGTIPDPAADAPAARATLATQADADPAGGAAGSPAARDDTGGAWPESGSRGLLTEWGGLLFLLNLAPEAGLPHAVLAEPDLGGRSLPWLLQAVAVTLVPVPGDDPALAAFAGLDHAEPSPWRTGPDATAGESRAVRRIAGRWAQAAASALGRPEDEGAAAVRALAARRGTVVFAPGWIEVVFALDDVDVDVRVAGLDLNPGWIPWLGCVLRYRYE